MNDRSSLLRLRASLQDLMTELDEALNGCDETWVPLKVAAHQAGVSSKTARRWCQRSDIGKKIGGRWSVNVERLKAGR